MLAYIFLIVLAVVSAFFTIYYILSLYSLLKGAPFVTTNRKLVKEMVDLADIQKGDKAYDLGCGDGRIIFEACKRGAIGIGFDVHPFLVWYCRLKNLFYKLPVKFYYGNILRQDLSDADVVFCYLLPGVMKELAKKFKELKPGTMVVSHGFKVPGWEMDRHYIEEEKKKTGNIFVYRV